MDHETQIIISDLAYLYFNTSARGWFVRSQGREMLVGFHSTDPHLAVEEAEASGYSVINKLNHCL